MRFRRSSRCVRAARRRPGSTALAQSTSRRSRGRAAAPPGWWRGNSTVKSRRHTAGRERPDASSWRRRFAPVQRARAHTRRRADRRRAATRSTDARARPCPRSGGRPGRAPGPAQSCLPPRAPTVPRISWRTARSVAPQPPHRSIPTAARKAWRLTASSPASTARCPAPRRPTVASIARRCPASGARDPTIRLPLHLPTELAPELPPESPPERPAPALSSRV